MKHRRGTPSRLRLAAMVAVALAGCGHPTRAAHRTEPPSAAIDAAAAIAPPPDASAVAGVDSDGDGIPDLKDLCPQQPMVMSAGCEPARQQGCPDDCRPPLHVNEPMR